MKNYIYYFTGTGNSLYAARRISERLEEAEVIDLTKVYKNLEPIEEADSIGIVVPVYVFGAPLLMDTFINQLNIGKCKYLYIVLVHGGAPYSAVYSLKRKMEKKGIQVHAGFEIVAPDNYLVELNPPNEEEALEILKDTDKELEDALTYIMNEKSYFPKVPKWKLWMGFALQPTFKSYAAKAPTKFTVNERCTGCSVCKQVCSQSVVQMGEGERPVWSEDGCEMCFACINLCPAKAIEFGKKTKGRRRYKNPRISLNDLKQ